MPGAVPTGTAPAVPAWVSAQTCLCFVNSQLQVGWKQVSQAVANQNGQTQEQASILAEYLYVER